MRRLIEASSEESSPLSRRWISRNRLLTVLRSTTTEKLSPAAAPRPYPVIDFIMSWSLVFGFRPLVLERLVPYCDLMRWMNSQFQRPKTKGHSDRSTDERLLPRRLPVLHQQTAI